MRKDDAMAVSTGPKNVLAVVSYTQILVTKVQMENTGYIKNVINVDKE